MTEGSHRRCRLWRVEEGCRFGEVIGDEITVVRLANHGVMVIGTDVADAWQKLYFFERACQLQVLAQSTGQPLIRVSDAIAEHTAAQWLKEAPKAAVQYELQITSYFLPLTQDLYHD